ncbi:MAG: hypothetical protein MJE66_20560 [Proteobacteria bacterium]|nr:hypothetical protein [Pseudomonadota bacterium]
MIPASRWPWRAHPRATALASLLSLICALAVVLLAPRADGREAPTAGAVGAGPTPCLELAKAGAPGAYCPIP